MAKEKTTFYSPKKGCRIKLPNSRKSYFSQLVDILSKLKTDTLEIRPDYMCASDGNLSIRTMLPLGVFAKVDRTEFKKVIKNIDSEFTTTLHDDTLEFTWGNGNATSIKIEPVKDESFGQLGKEEAMFDDEDFYHSLVCGSSGASADSTGRLASAHYDGNVIVSTDNVLIAMSDYAVSHKPNCTISAKTLDLWKAVNLPTKYICVYENGIQIMIRDDIIIKEITNHSKVELLNEKLTNRILNFKALAGNKFKLPDDFWKTIAPFKNCKEITIANKKIFSNEDTVLKVATEITPFDKEEDSFSVKLDELKRLQPLVTGTSDFSVINIDMGDHIDSYLYVEPDVGLDDVIVLGGISKEK